MISQISDAEISSDGITEKLIFLTMEMNKISDILCCGVSGEAVKRRRSRGRRVGADTEHQQEGGRILQADNNPGRDLSVAARIADHRCREGSIGLL